MPLTPAYTWSENETTARIEIKNVPIKDQSQIFCSDRVVKLNAPPYLLLLDLHGAIDDDLSIATVQHGCKVVFQLVKAECGLWGRLVAQGDKQHIKQQRDASVQRAHNKQLAAAQERLARRQQQEKAAINQQIAEEHAQHDRIEALKQQELCQARQELQQWQQQLPPPCNGEQQQQPRCAKGMSQQPAAMDAAVPISVDHDDYYGKGWRHISGKHEAAVVQEEAQADKAGAAVQGASHRAAHQGRALSSSGSVIEPSALTPDLGTIGSNITSACSLAAPEQSGCDIWVSSSRSMIVDGKTDGKTATSSCSERPDVPVQPVVPVRARAAPISVEFTKLETAAHLPARGQRAVEFKSIKRSNQDDSVDVADRQPAYLKDKGDALAAQGNYSGAIHAYTRALQLDPDQPALWSNRSACHLALGNALDCRDDCSTAIQLVEKLQQQLHNVPGETQDEEIAAGLLPAAVNAAGAGSISTAMEAAASAVPASATDTVSGMVPGEAFKTQLNLGDQIHSTATTTTITTTTTTGNNSSTLASSSTGLHLATHQLPGDSGTAARLHKMLVKLLARRALASVKLEQLEQAEQDLQFALRMDPANPKLQAHLLELQVAMHPQSGLGMNTIKQRADARFKAGDALGGVEAYTLLIQLVQQQEEEETEQQQQEQQHESKDQLQQQGEQCTDQHEQQSWDRSTGHAVDAGSSCGADELARHQPDDHHALLLSALSNRAACWLSLQEYNKCTADCQQALCCIMSTAGLTQHLAVAAAPAAPAVTCADSNMAPAPAAENALQLLSQLSPELLLQGPGPGHVRAVARLSSRLAVAQGCLKQVQAAQQLFALAQQYWQALGEAQRVAELGADQDCLVKCTD